jgi:hypothetical protein
MKLTMDWSLFFNKLETKKAKWFYSKAGRILLETLGFITGEYICGSCNISRFIRERPGEFRDFDADHEQGGDGVPLCSGCLGTGKFQKTTEFKKLQEEISRIRKESFALQMKASQEKKWDEAYKKKLKDLNNQLSAVAKRGLELIRYPSKGCLAKELTGCK